MIHPDPDDVIVRPRRGNPHLVYLVGTKTTADQYVVQTREAAVAQAVAFAKRHEVRAWWVDEGNDTRCSSARFRSDDIRPARLA